MKNSYTRGPWTLEAGRTIVTPSGQFYLTYGKEERTGLPLFRDFVELDEIARCVSKLPEMVEALRLCEKGFGELGRYTIEAKALTAVRKVLREIEEASC